MSAVVTRRMASSVGELTLKLVGRSHGSFVERSAPLYLRELGWG